MKRLACPAAGLALLGLLLHPLMRELLSARMSLHLGLQLPALLAAGLLIAWPARHGLARALAPWNPQGLNSALLLLTLASLAMLPRVIDAVLADPVLEAAKLVALPLGGALLAVHRTAAGAVMQAFLIGNVAWMLAVGGLLMLDAELRYCNAYLIDDQQHTGLLMLLAAGLLPLGLWPRRAAAPPCPAQA